MDQWVPPHISSVDEDDAAYDQRIFYGNVYTVEAIQTTRPIERIDPFKRAARKRDYNCLSASKYAQPQELVEQSEPVQKTTKKRDHNCLSTPKCLRHSYRK